MLQDLKTHIEKVHLFKIHSLQPLSGGDINAVYLLNTTQGNFVLKLNSTKKLPDMFKKEAAGLVTLSNTNCIDVPKVIGFGEQQGSGFL